LILGDCLTELKKIEPGVIDCCITSPPYWGLRDYGVSGQLGLEKTPEEYVAKMVEVFREVKRVLKKEGTCWLNLGDSYNGGGRGGMGCDNASIKQFTNTGTLTMPKINIVPELKPKDLIGIPWRVAFALQADGWYLRQDIIWAKPNPMPESVTDRCTKSHEYIFLLAKNQKYYFDNETIAEPVSPDSFRTKRPMTSGAKAQTSPYTQGQPQGRTCGVGKNGKRNKRSVWTVTTKPFKGAHFATFPEDLILPCVLAGCPKDGLILDPFAGAGTTGVVAKKNNRNFVGIELNEKYLIMAQQRINNTMENLL